MKEFTKTQKLTISAICMALYLLVMVCTQSFAFGQYQIRISTALYGLSAIFPFLVVPFGLANMFSNLVLGGLVLVSTLIVGQAIAGVCGMLLVTALERSDLRTFVWEKK